MAGINKTLNNIIALWTLPVATLWHIGDTVEITSKCYLKDIGDNSTGPVIYKTKGILLGGSQKSHLFVWSKSVRSIMIMPHGTPTPSITRMVLTEKYMFREL
jgi:hypothetical protein